MEFLRQLFGSGDFRPHGYCYLWNGGLVWLHVMSDLLIALAYFTIPVTLLWFVRKRRDLPFSWMFVLFGVFIVACGATHLMEVWNLWHANYWLAGAVKAVTALASVPTAILLAKLIPEAVELPSAVQWIHANAALEKEIRDRREIELNLRISESAYREQAELLDLTHDGIFVRGLDGRINYWSRGAERLYGWTRAEAHGKISHELLRTEFPEPVTQIESKVKEDGYWEGELVHRKRDGGTVIVASRWALRTGSNGEPSAFLESNRDVTSRRKAEEDIQNLNRELNRRLSDLNLVNKELESFSYSVSHDLRAPLRHIDGFARILKEEYAQGLPAEGHRYLDRVIDAANHMGHLVDDLLNLARIGRKPIQQETADLNKIVRDVAAGLAEENNRREIDWRIGELPEEYCDPGLLRLVFTNLLSNAVKFTRRRPRSVIEVGAKHEGGVTTFFVRDNGVGFDPKYADKLFGVFQRLHNQEDFEGTGVGLATVQRIILRHGGKVWAESQPDCGCTFFFTLEQQPEPVLAQT